MSTTTELAPAVRLQILKHLATGKSLDVTAAIVSMDRADVLDVASRHGYPDRAKLSWAADIVAQGISDAQNQIPAGAPRRTVPPAPVAPSRSQAQRPPAPTARPVGPTAASADAPGSADQLLATAADHPSRRIQAAAARAQDAIQKVRDLIAEDEKKNAARRRAEQEKEAARAEIARLQAELAAAKAKLRPTKAKAASKNTRKSPAKTGEMYPCRNTGCAKEYDTPQGRSMHERLKCDHRPQAES